MKSKLFCTRCIGIEFIYHGDSVVILWPWKWKFRKWKLYWLLSLGFESGFYSFTEIDKLWRDYFRDCRIQKERRNYEQ